MMSLVDHDQDIMVDHGEDIMVDHGQPLVDISR